MGRSRIVLAMLAAAAVAGCSTLRRAAPAADGQGVREGRYAYVGRYMAPGAGEPRVFRGVLVVTRANGERIVGRWEVPGFAPELQLGGWANGGYDADAEVVTGTIGTFKHRLARGDVPNAVACTGVFIGRVSGSAVSNPATCELLYLAQSPGLDSSR